MATANYLELNINDNQGLAQAFQAFADKVMYNVVILQSLGRGAR
jgi:hypothetical protein